MSRIDNLIAEMCPDGVEFKTLGDVGTFVRGNGLQKKDLLTEGVGAIHYGQVFTTYGTSTYETKSFVSPNLAARLRRARPGDLVIATTSENDEDVCKAVAWLGEGEIAVSGDAFVYSHQLDPLYAAYFFQTEAFQAQKRRFISGTKVKRVSGSDLARIKIPVPPMEVQREIASILDKMESLKAELEAELEYRSRQYAFYRDQLLDFRERAGVRWVPMGEALAMRAGQHLPASQILAAETEGWHVPVFGGNGLRGYGASASHSGPHILVGRQGALCGNVRRVDGDFYATEHAVVGKTGSDLDTNFAYHLLTQMDLNQYKSSGAQPGLAVSVLANIKVPIPALDVQVRIASLLDRFDALVNDLSIGLPAEIAARQKQYEYYRDKLLTFPEKEAS